MIRRFNYTGRKAINRSDTNLRIEENPLRFSAGLSLADYDLPSDAKVFVEAYRQTNWMRFNFGTVGAVTPASDLRLSAFDTPEGILFRVRVTATTDPEGRLLAEADQISPVHRSESGEEMREPLLPPKGEDLGEEVYRVDFTGRPLLLINNQFGDWRTLARSPFFVTIALPQAMREILNRIVRVEEYFNTDDPDDWRAQWLQFAATLPGSSEPPREEEKDAFDDWIDAAVAAFSRAHGMKARFGSYWPGGSKS